MKINKNRRNVTILLLISILVSCSSPSLMNADIEQSNLDSNQSYKRLRVVEQDSLALVAIYNATNGKYWFGKNQWLENEIEKWKGVTTDIVNGERRVVKLNLGVMNLSGNLPNEIGNLTALKRLLLSENIHLTGSLPEGIYQLKALETLIIKYSGIEGKLSSSIKNLTQLDTLDLWGDARYYAHHEKSNSPRLSGKLPKELGQLKKLRFLRLGRNDFEGEIPSEMGQMTNLNFCDLADCHLIGGIPESFGNLKHLRTLFLSENRLTRPIPEVFCQAEALEIFYLNNNQIEGQIPRNINYLRNLRTFSVSNNKISGTIPETIGENLKLGLLYLDNNKLSGEIPKSMAHDRCRITFATFANNNLSGLLPEFPGNPYLLESEIWYPVIEAQNNRLTGVLPNHYLRWRDIAKKRLLPQQEGFGFVNLK